MQIKQLQVSHHTFTENAESKMKQKWTIFYQHVQRAFPVRISNTKFCAKLRATYPLNVISRLWKIHMVLYFSNAMFARGLNPAFLAVLSVPTFGRHEQNINAKSFCPPISTHELKEIR